MIKLPNLESAEAQNRKVFLRLDLDVSIENGKISDNFRLLATFPTLKFLLDQNCPIIIAGHLGRPEGKDLKLTLKPVADWYAAKFKIQSSNIKIGEFDGWKIGKKIQLLENLRFYPEEEANDLEFAKKLSSLSEIYINDAFAASHRSHASIVGMPKFLPHYAGLRFQKEVEELSKVLDNPKRPLTVIIGGAKIETKLPLVEKMHHFADYVLVGGEIAENDKILAKVAHEKQKDKKSILIVSDLTADNKDITEHSAQNFVQVIKNSKTVVWNGPMGLFEECFDLGTREIAKAIASSGAYTIVGGGDTVTFLKNEGLLDKFSFVSTGGGAMLEFLSGEQLPGISVLTK